MSIATAYSSRFFKADNRLQENTNNHRYFTTRVKEGITVKDVSLNGAAEMTIQSHLGATTIIFP